jgi:hypothetical protein
MQGDEPSSSMNRSPIARKHRRPWLFARNPEKSGFAPVVTTPSVIPTGMLEKSFSPPHRRGMSVGHRS